MKKEAAFSGLEAAIVLIAFVVVAAVFSYVMLGAGFFATQKSQEVTYSGIKQTTSNLILDGQMYGASTHFTTLTFWLAIPQGGDSQNLGTADLTMLWTLNNEAVQTVTSYEVDDTTATSTHLLNSGANAKIDLSVPTGYVPSPGDSFTLEIKPRVGASTLTQKTLETGYHGGAIL